MRLNGKILRASVLGLAMLGTPATAMASTWIAGHYAPNGAYVPGHWVGGPGLWINGHYGPGGIWVAGHWANGVGPAPGAYEGPPGPAPYGSHWVPGHYGPGGVWYQGHWVNG